MFDTLKLRKRVDELEDQVSDLRRKFAAIVLEWSDNLERLRRMLQRITKERQRIEQLEPTSPPEELESGEPTTAGNGLTARQAEIQARILARRNRGGRPQ